MSDEVGAISEVSSSSSSSSSHETHESHETSSTQSTSETSSSSSSSSNNKTEETHGINTNDSTTISHEAHEADESDGGHSVNMNWLSKDEAIEQATMRDEQKNGTRELQELNKTYGQLLVDYERSYMNETTYDIEDLPKLDKYDQFYPVEEPRDANCSNFQSSILDNTGNIEKRPHSDGFLGSPDNTCDVLDNHLEEDGWEKVDRSEAQAGDIVIMLEKKDDSSNRLVHGHTEMVTGVDKDGNIREVLLQNEIDLIIEENGVLYPIEIKKKDMPTINDANAFDVLDKDIDKRRGMGVILSSNKNKVYFFGEWIVI